MPRSSTLLATGLAGAALASIALVASPARAQAPQMSLSYATQLGSTDNRTGAMTAAPDGSIYVAQLSKSGELPITGTQSSEENVLWVAKFNPAATSGPLASDPTLVWAIEMDGFHRAWGTAVGPDGDFYVTGWTMSQVPGPAGAYDPTPNGGRAPYIARFDADTGARDAYTFFSDPVNPGGRGQDLAIGPNNEVALVGGTDTPMPTTSTAYSRTYTGTGKPGEIQPWVAVLDGDLSSLFYASYLPDGDDLDTAYAVAFDAAGDLWVAGNYDARSSGIPTAPFAAGDQSASNGGQEGFLFKIDPNASGAASLVYGTYLGGSGDEWLEDLALDAAGSIWVVGTTTSSDLPGAPGSPGGRTDALIAKFAPSGARLATRYFGGSDDDGAIGLGFDPGGCAVIGGSTRSDDLGFGPTAYDPTHNSRRKDDVFVTRLDTALGTIDGTYLGGSDNDTCTSVAVDSQGNACVGGAPVSLDFPVTVTSSQNNSFVAVISFTPPPPQPGILVSPTAGLVTTEAGGAATFDVVLGSAPTATVTIGVTSSDLTEGVASTSALSFDASNWSLQQTVVVTGVDDLDPDGDQEYSIVLSQPTSADPTYASIDPADPAVTNRDDEQVAGLDITGMSPASLARGQTSVLTIVGLGFLPGATVLFEGGKGRAPETSNVMVIDPTTIGGIITVPSRAKAGEVWDLRVTNPDGSSDVLPGAFTVTQ